VVKNRILSGQWQFIVNARLDKTLVIY